MKNLTLLLVTLTLISNILLAQSSPDREYTYQFLNQNGFNLQWRTTSNNNLEVILNAPTTGWISVGFGAQNAMAGANIIIAYVSNGNLNIRDDYGVSQTSHNSDINLGGADNISNSSGTEQNGTTEVKFQIPLNSGDSFDKLLTPGQNISLILARGSNNADNFTSMHSSVATGNILIPDPPIALAFNNLNAAWDNNRNAVISWDTSNESNISTFRILRSDNPQFENPVIITPNPIIPQNTGQGSYSYTDLSSSPDQLNYFKIEAVELDNSIHFSNLITLNMLSNDSPETSENKLYIKNYPNPFNPVTTIAYNIPKTDFVDIFVYNSKGQLIKTLFKGYKQKGSYHDLVWDGKDNKGKDSVSGIYLLILKSSYTNNGKKLILLK